MAHLTGEYADCETLREQAVTLRRQGLSRRQIRDRLRVHDNDTLDRLLQGEPPPAWTGTPTPRTTSANRPGSCA